LRRRDLGGHVLDEFLGGSLGGTSSVSTMSRGSSSGSIGVAVLREAGVGALDVLRETAVVVGLQELGPARSA
jgi:hypothetical protein